MTPDRLKNIEGKIAQWREIAADNDPMNAMLNVMTELVAEVKDLEDQLAIAIEDDRGVL